jgi:hypothetical protein
MRQGGLKPKSHSSGVYWVRANANTGGGGSKADVGSGSVGVFEILLVVISISIIIAALPLFAVYEIYRKISDRG